MSHIALHYSSHILPFVTISCSIIQADLDSFQGFRWFLRFLEYTDM